VEFSPIVQKISEADGGELKADKIWDAFVNEFIEVKGEYELLDYTVQSIAENQTSCQAKIRVGENEVTVNGEGSGPIDAFIAAMVETLNEPLNVMDYQEYSLNEGSEAQAICILSISDDDQNKFYGVGISQNTTTAAFKSIIAAINRKWR
jgi:2-isopropylmalate synthase